MKKIAVHDWKIKKINSFNSLKHARSSPLHMLAPTHAHQHTTTLTTKRRVTRLHMMERNHQSAFIYLMQLHPNMKMKHAQKRISVILQPGAALSKLQPGAAAAWMEPFLWSEGKVPPGDLEFQRVFPLKHTRVHFKGKKVILHFLSGIMLLEVNETRSFIAV